MITQRYKILRGCALVTLLLFLNAAPVFAAIDEVPVQHKGSILAKQPALFSANELIGSHVKSRASMTMTTDTENKEAVSENKKTNIAKLGTVKEMIISEDHQRLHYVVIDSHGKYYPVPWRAFSLEKAGLKPARESETSDSINIINPIGSGIVYPPPDVYTKSKASHKSILFLDISEDMLMRAPKIESVSVEMLKDSEFRHTIDAFYKEHIKGFTPLSMPDKTGTTASMVKTDLVKATDVIGLKLQNTPDTNLGKIKDLVADGHEGRITFGLVEFGGIFGIGDSTAAIPWSSMTLNTKEGYARTDATRENLEAAVVEKEYLDKLSRPEFARQIYEVFGVEPSMVYGFVPGEMVRDTLSSWRPDSEYNKNFNPEKVMTVKGTITDVGVFEPEQGAAPGIQLKILTDENKSIVLNAGPQKYAGLKEISFKIGDEIEVTGSKASINNKEVIIASKIILVDGKTLQLRDSSGKPLWDIDNLSMK